MKLPKPAKRVKRRRKPVRRVRRTRPGVPSMKRLDDLARALCRSRGRCEAAGWRGTECKGPLQWAHIVSRQYKRNNLRWRMDNCLLLCAGHHFRWTRKNEAEWHHFLRDIIGIEAWGNLEREGLFGEKPDRAAMLIALERMTAEGANENVLVEKRRELCSIFSAM